jgi:hypothetical protein
LSLFISLYMPKYWYCFVISFVKNCIRSRKQFLISIIQICNFTTFQKHSKIAYIFVHLWFFKYKLSTIKQKLLPLGCQPFCFVFDIMIMWEYETIGQIIKILKFIFFVSSVLFWFCFSWSSVVSSTKTVMQTEVILASSFKMIITDINQNILLTFIRRF